MIHYDKIEPIVESISETLEKIGEPLTDRQKLILAPAIMVWFEKLLKEQNEQQD